MRERESQTGGGGQVSGYVWYVNDGRFRRRVALRQRKSSPWTGARQATGFGCSRMVRYRLVSFSPCLEHSFSRGEVGKWFKYRGTIAAALVSSCAM